MDANRFDRWTKALAARSSRRSVFRVISGAFLARQVAPPIASASGTPRVEGLSAIIVSTADAPLISDKSYTADPNPDLSNPERGMYFADWESGDSHTIVAKWLYLDEVCNQELTWNRDNPDLSSLVLKNYAAQLDEVRAQASDLLFPIKVLFRPRYDKPNTEPNRCGLYHSATMDLQQNHIEAVAAMLGDYKDVIAFIQAGYLGRWGEWNTYNRPDSTAPFLYNTSKRNQIIDWVLEAYAAEDIKQDVELRRPVLAKQVIDRYEKENKPPPNIGLHNDCFMTSNSDTGTYSDLEVPPFEGGTFTFGTSAAAKQWAQQTLTPNASFGGETCPVTDRDGNYLLTERWRLCRNVVDANDDPATLHLNYLNAEYAADDPDAGVLGAVSTWDQGDAEGRKCYDDLRHQLGYRFEVTRVEYTPRVTQGEMFQVRVDVANTGWAKLHKPRQAMLVLRNDNPAPPSTAISSGRSYPFSLGDVEGWAPGQTTTISVNAQAPSGEGEYSVRLRIPDPDVDRRDRRWRRITRAYAVKLATLRDGANVFDPATGDNDLGVSITVQPAGCPTGKVYGASCAANEECCSGICQAQMCVATIAGTCRRGDDFREDESATCCGGDGWCFQSVNRVTVCAWATKCVACESDPDCWADWSRDSLCVQNGSGCESTGGSKCVLPCTPFVQNPD